jgi:hypothetical protein
VPLQSHQSLVILQEGDIPIHLDDFVPAEGEDIIDGRIRAADSLRLLGNEAFKAGDYSSAVRRYNIAVKYLSAMDLPKIASSEQTLKMTAAETSCLLNRCDDHISTALS